MSKLKILWAFSNSEYLYGYQWTYFGKTAQGSFLRGSILLESTVLRLETRESLLQPAGVVVSPTLGDILGHSFVFM